ncbi:MAG: hypothetical protein DWQ34_08225 [Planctomycetota bacterium]|nr:MAG: hypothetical protein DWQ34_08225 [Planctomycetota bacterium]REK31329.1 MAG: hypothetical protein DWQ41_00310 [Planctomycetota bacterium]REK39054.1 MAG: hypothetical protein DWQ45_02350 [Planctomycetota bacterium]
MIREARIDSANRAIRATTDSWRQQARRMKAAEAETDMVREVKRKFSESILSAAGSVVRRDRGTRFDAARVKS